MDLMSSVFHYEIYACMMRCHYKDSEYHMYKCVLYFQGVHIYTGNLENMDAQVSPCVGCRVT